MERHPQSGWFATVQRLAETLLSIIRNRIELIAVEVQEEKQRIITTFVFAVVAVFFGFVSVIVATLTIVFLTPPEARPYVLLGFSVLYVLVTLFAGFSVRKKLREHRPFAESINELKKDVAALRSRP